MDIKKLQSKFIYIRWISIDKIIGSRTILESSVWCFGKDVHTQILVGKLQEWRWMWCEWNGWICFSIEFNWCWQILIYIFLNPFFCSLVCASVNIMWLPVQFLRFGNELSIWFTAMIRFQWIKNWKWFVFDRLKDGKLLVCWCQSNVSST